MQCYAFEIVRTAIRLRVNNAPGHDNLCDLDVVDALSDAPETLLELLLRDRAAFDRRLDQALDSLTVALPAAA
jgi:hypothetical protein